MPHVLLRVNMYLYTFINRQTKYFETQINDFIRAMAVCKGFNHILSSCHGLVVHKLTFKTKCTAQVFQAKICQQFLLSR